MGVRKAGGTEVIWENLALIYMPDGRPFDSPRGDITIWFSGGDQDHADNAHP